MYLHAWLATLLWLLLLHSPALLTFMIVHWPTLRFVNSHSQTHQIPRNSAATSHSAKCRHVGSGPRPHFFPRGNHKLSRKNPASPSVAQYHGTHHLSMLHTTHIYWCLQPLKWCRTILELATQLCADSLGKRAGDVEGAGNLNECTCWMLHGPAGVHKCRCGYMVIGVASILMSSLVMLRARSD